MYCSMKLPINMNNIDRGIRIVFSLTLIYIGFINAELINNSIINYLIGGFGVFNLFSALAGFCPVYFFAHISTAPNPEND